MASAGWWRWNSRSAEVAGPPTVAVLPLANISGDPDLKYFADGTTEKFVTNLARSPQIKVVARTSTEAYRGKPIDIRQVGRELGARYVLQGSIQKGSDKLRIVAQLIDARSGEHIWAETFDRQSADALALQDEVSDSIVRTLAGDAGLIKKKQYEEAWGKDAAQLDEWDYYLRGHELFARYNKEDMNKAVQIWEQGLSKYPDSALLKVKLGWAHYQRWFFGWTADSQREAEMASQFAEQVLASNRTPPLAMALAHWLRGYVYGDIEGDYERAVNEEKIAIRTPARGNRSEAGHRLLFARGRPCGRSYLDVGMAGAGGKERSFTDRGLLQSWHGFFCKDGLPESSRQLTRTCEPQ